MTKLGDKVELTFNPWSSYPRTAIKTVVDENQYNSLSAYDRFFTILIDDPLIKKGQVWERIDNWYIHPETEVWMPKITHIKMKNMSEVKEPMKTDIHDSIYIGKLMTKYSLKAETPTLIKVGNKCLKWEEHEIASGKAKHPTEVLITEDNVDVIKSLVKAGDGNFNSIWLQPIPKYNYPKSKRKASKIKKRNIKKLYDTQKEIHDFHKPQCISVKRNSFIYKYKLADTEEDLNKDGGFYYEVRAKSERESLLDPIVAKNKFIKLVAILNKSEGLKRSSWKQHKRSPKTDDSNLHNHLRAVCIQNMISGEVRRMQWYKANKLANTDENWKFAPKFAYKKWLREERDLRKDNPKDGLTRSPNHGGIYTRRDGTRERRIKGVPGNRKVITQQIRKPILGKDETTKKKLLTIKVPIYRYVIMPQIVTGKWGGYHPAGTVLGTRIKKFCIGYETVTKEIEYTPIRKYTTKTIKCYNPSKKIKPVLSVEESAKIKQLKEQKKADQNRNRRKRKQQRKLKRTK